MNDSSTDRTAEIASKAGTKVIHVNKRQIGAVRNAGAAEALGEIFIFVDADTIVPPETLRDVEEVLKDPRTVAGGAKLLFDSPPPFWGRLVAGVFLFVYFATNHAAGGFIFARREAFQKAGGFDESYFAAEEKYLSKALRKLGKLRIVKHPVITSARKFRMKPLREHFALFKNMVRKGRRGFKERDGLEMWYDGAREK